LDAVSGVSFLSFSVTGCIQERTWHDFDGEQYHVGHERVGVLEESITTLP
jgi:hypothetical protein